MGTDESEREKPGRLQVTGFIELPGGRDSEPSSYQRERDGKEDWWRKATFGLELLILLLTIAATIAAIKVAGYTYETWRETKRSADAAWSAAINTSRAWLLITEVRSSEFGIEFRMRNTGSGPAINPEPGMTWLTNAADCDRKSPTTLTLQNLNRGTPTIPQGDEVADSFGWSFGEPLPDTPEWKFARIVVSYRDQFFPEQPKRETGVCLKLDPGNPDPARRAIFYRAYHYAD